MTDSSMPSRPTPPPARFRGAAGFTLIEVVVTLVILAVAAAIVAPFFRQASTPNDNLGTVVAAARELAVRRGETLLLHVDGASWRITGVRGDTIGSGATSARSGALRVRVTALGACFIEGGPGPGASAWDAIACQPSRGTAER